MIGAGGAARRPDGRTRPEQSDHCATVARPRPAGLSPPGAADQLQRRLRPSVCSRSRASVKSMQLGRAKLLLPSDPCSWTAALLVRAPNVRRFQRRRRPPACVRPPAARRPALFQTGSGGSSISATCSRSSRMRSCQ
jgi:hypothetical protein